MSTPSSICDDLASEDASDPVVDVALKQAEEYAAWLNGKPLSAHQAMVVVMLRRIRELEAENEMLRRLK